MIEEPTPRQVLYALVGAGFLLIVAVLIIGASVAGLVPLWWTVVTTVLLAGAGVWSASNWRRTGPVLAYSIGLFVAWTIGTLLIT